MKQSVRPQQEDQTIEDKIPVNSNHPLYKWKKAQVLVQENRVSIDFPDEQRTHIKVEGVSDTYLIGLDMNPGTMKCSCPTEHYSRENQYVECCHTLAAHKFLSEIPEEKAKEIYL